MESYQECALCSDAIFDSLVFSPEEPEIEAWNRDSKHDIRIKTSHNRCTNSDCLCNSSNHESHVWTTTYIWAWMHVCTNHGTISWNMSIINNYGCCRWMNHSPQIWSTLDRIQSQHDNKTQNCTWRIRRCDSNFPNLIITLPFGHHPLSQPSSDQGDLQTMVKLGFKQTVPKDGSKERAYSACQREVCSKNTH
jgi:hypothetical protein